MLLYLLKRRFILRRLLFGHPRREVDNPHVASRLHRRMEDHTLVDAKPAPLSLPHRLEVHFLRVQWVVEKSRVGIRQHEADRRQGCALTEGPGPRQDLDGSSGFGEDDTGLHDLLRVDALVVDIGPAVGAGRRVVAAQHLNPVQSAQIPRVDDLEEAECLAFEHHLEHLVLPPAVRGVDGIRPVALFSHVGGRDDAPVVIQLICLHPVAEAVADDVEAEPTGILDTFRGRIVHRLEGTGARGDQRAHAGHRIRPWLQVGDHGARHWTLRHGEVDVTVEPVDVPFEAVAVVAQDQLAVVEEIWIPRRLVEQSSQRAHLCREAVKVDEFESVHRRVDACPQLVGRNHRQRFVTDEDGRLAVEGQAHRHVVLPGSLGRRDAILVA